MQNNKGLRGKNGLFILTGTDTGNFYCCLTVKKKKKKGFRGTCQDRVCVSCYSDRWNVEQTDELSSQGSVPFITQELLSALCLSQLDNIGVVY